jgi:hypothetical protein
MNRQRVFTGKRSPAWVDVFLFSFFSLASLIASVSPARAAFPPVDLPAAPVTPTIGSAVYNITVSNSNINGGTAASTGSSNNASTINAYITYCSNNGGGTVEVPAGLFKSGAITIKNNVNLQLDSGSTLQASSAGGTLITTSGSGLHDMEITGSGILDGNASTATGNNLVSIQNVNRLLISGVTIENAGHEHLVPEKDTNVTINGININDHNSITSATNTTHTYLGNTDGIDYSGSNFLIENCNIADGDDDIVAKPASTACNNIVVYNCNIYSGHGISIGGGTAAGVSNMIVANCAFNTNLGTDPTKNSITYALRMKAEDGNDPSQTQSGDVGGGTTHPLKNVKYINISMTGAVQRAIAIESFYDGGDTFADTPNDTAFYTYGPDGTAPTAVSSSSPLWQNISFENVTATTTSNVGRINGLNLTTDPVNKPYANAIDGLAFANVHLTGSSQFQLWYGANVDLTGLTVSGTSESLYGLTNQAPGTVPLIVGDFNRDGHVNAADIQAMMLALSNLTSYRQTYFPLEVASQYDALFNDQLEVIGDLNNDFAFNNADMQAFLTLLSQNGFGSTSSVPEPASLTMLVFGLLALAAFYTHQRSASRRQKCTVPVKRLGQ